MSRQFDESYIYFPDDYRVRDEVEYSGIKYARINGYDHYFVSEYGDVISLVHGEAKPLKPYSLKSGHLCIDLSKGKGMRDKRLVHRLVAEGFIPNPENYPIVRHLDDIPYNNDYRNLAWGTHKDNTADARRNGGMYFRGVYCYELDKTFNSVDEAAKYFGVDKSNITSCCRGNSHTVRGKHLCYEDEKRERLNDPDWLTERSPYKPVIAIDKEGNRTRYSSRNEAAEKLGIPACGISNTIHGTTKHTHGYRFEEG